MKHIISFALALLLIFSLCACNFIPTPKPTIVLTTEPAETPEPTVDPSVAYAEYFGLAFPEEYTLKTGVSRLDDPDEKLYSVEVPFFAFLKKPTTWEYIPDTEDAKLVKNGLSFTTIKDLKLSPGEDEGTLKLSFILGIGGIDGMEFIFDPKIDPEKYRFSQFFPDYIFFDYYSGMTIAPPFFVSPSYDSQKIDSSLSTEFNGEPVHIKLEASEIVWTDKNDEPVLQEDGMMHKSLYAEGDAMYSFIIPENYDGLCMGVLNSQYPEGFEYREANYVNFMTSMPLAEFAEREGIKNLQEEITYIRLSELVKAFENNA